MSVKPPRLTPLPEAAPAAPITLTLVVSFEGQSFDDVMSSVMQIVEEARGYARPVKATLTGIPSVVEMSV